MKLTKRDIQEGINAVKKKAEKSFRRGNCYEAMHYLNVCSSLLGQFNLQYSPLEQIFNNMTMKDKENKSKVEIKINEEILELFC